MQTNITVHFVSNSFQTRINLASYNVYKERIVKLTMPNSLFMYWA